MCTSKYTRPRTVITRVGYVPPPPKHKISIFCYASCLWLAWLKFWIPTHGISSPGHHSDFFPEIACNWSRIQSVIHFWPNELSQKLPISPEFEPFVVKAPLPECCRRQTNTTKTTNINRLLHRSIFPSDGLGNERGNFLHHIFLHMFGTRARAPRTNARLRCYNFSLPFRFTRWIIPVKEHGCILLPFELTKAWAADHKGISSNIHASIQNMEYMRVTGTLWQIYWACKVLYLHYGPKFELAVKNGTTQNYTNLT